MVVEACRMTESEIKWIRSHVAVVETVHFAISVSIARGTVGVRSPEAAIQISSSIMGEMITRCFTVNMGYTQMLHSLPAWSVLCSFMFAQ